MRLHTRSTVRRLAAATATIWGLMAQPHGLAHAASATAPASAPARAPQGPTAGARTAPARVQRGFDAHYGIYVGGQKVGWMRATYAARPVPTLTYHLEAEVRGMGRTSAISLDESRIYAAGPDGLLQRLDFVQRAETGAVEVHGRREGAQFAADVHAGGAISSGKHEVGERLGDALALYTITQPQGGRAPKVGQRRTALHFDPSTQKVSRAELHVDAIERRLVAGVSTQLFTVTTSYPELGVSEASVVDAAGSLLQTHMGGFFEARLEPIEIAKKKELVQDMLLQAVVAVPRPIPSPESQAQLTLTMAGFDDAFLPPASARQQVLKTPQGTRLVLRRDAPIGAVPLTGAAAADAPPEPAEVAEARRASPFIQSDAPEIVAFARRALGPTRDTADAVARLVRATAGHLRAEYVPAFSNALEALHSARGDCTEHSVLFVALARAAGIPARPVVGVAYWPPGHGLGWHAWAEVWVDGRWIAVDPTWRQPLADATHIKLADGGPEQQARVVMLLGKLRVVDISWP